MSSTDSFDQWLVAEGASHDLVAWVRSNALDWPELYRTCPRADFLLALAVRAGADAESLRRAALAVARRALVDLESDELEAGLRALEDVGAASGPRDELAARFDAAADATNDLVLAYGHRVLAVAANVHREPDALAALPGFAIELTLATVLDCAMTSVVGAMQAELADIVRRELPLESIPVRW